MCYIVIIACVPWIFYAITLAIFAAALIYGRFHLYKTIDPTVLYNELPGVSIIKALVGTDPCLESNLESHFTLNYPKFEILFCFHDDQDPAIKLVHHLRERYPKVDCKLFIGGRDGILNSVVCNMSPAYDDAKYDIIWVSNSRIKATTKILLDMVGRLHIPKMALVSQMPFTTDQTGLVAAVDKVFFGAKVARYHLISHVIGFRTLIGMSYLVKKSALDKVNGLSWFGRFLAEDHFIAKHLSHMWLQLRLNMMPFTAGVLEPLGESLPLGIYMAWSMHHFFDINPYLWFSIHWTTWFILDYLHLRMVQCSPLPFSLATLVIAWLIRETLYIFVYFEAVINVRRIKWGKRTYRLSSFGEHLDIVDSQ